MQSRNAGNQVYKGGTTKRTIVVTNPLKFRSPFLLAFFFYFKY
ncbi:hypothetical protein V6Z11_D11G275800 [Gossypium hirsutum]